MMDIKRLGGLLLIWGYSQGLMAQERIAPLLNNEALRHAKLPVQLNAATNLTLPFFEDFTDYSPFPRADYWEEQYVFVNNTMGVNPVSRGVATFDALNEKGDLYEQSTSVYSQFYADTLTSKEIDLSTFTIADSIYLSFFYQSKGHGFAPRPSDSLVLYFLKSNGSWQHVWSVGGNIGMPSFAQVMIPLTDTGYFNDKFRMRWMNYATKGLSNSNWNLDYIRLDAGRTAGDTVLNDIAFAQQPGSILNDFYAMPFSHFKTNANSFLKSSLAAVLRNNGLNSVTLNTGFEAIVQDAGTVLGAANSTLPVTANGTSEATFAMYNAGSYNPLPDVQKVVYNHRFYSNSAYSGEYKTNDTLHTQQVFDNYFAYDDGSAEKSYYLKLFGNAPGETAIEYALYHPDTLRGVAIRFAREMPQNTGKEFSIAVYRQIAFGGGVDQEVYREEGLFPSFIDSVDKFTYYPFTDPVLLQPGVFFVSIVQAAGGTSDSLQIALDDNREGANHRYFKVDGTWEASQLEGALLVRPIVGQTPPLSIKNPFQTTTANWQLSPNPVADRVFIDFKQQHFVGSHYQVIDVAGRVLLHGTLTSNHHAVDVAKLPQGMYFLRIEKLQGSASIKRFSKIGQ